MRVRMAQAAFLLTALCKTPTRNQPIDLLHSSKRLGFTCKLLLLITTQIHVLYILYVSVHEHELSLNGAKHHVLTFWDLSVTTN